MFTGIIEELGTVAAIEQQNDAVRLTIACETALSDAGLGDSIAVNGCCLTVMAQEADVFSADVMAESLDKTSLGDLAPGAEVNLERAMAAGGRMGGHVVQGHVDGTGALIDRTPSEHWEVVRLSLPGGKDTAAPVKGTSPVTDDSLAA